MLEKYEKFKILCEDLAINPPKKDQKVKLYKKYISRKKKKEIFEEIKPNNKKESWILKKLEISKEKISFCRFESGEKDAREYHNLSRDKIFWGSIEKVTETKIDEDEKTEKIKVGIPKSTKKKKKRIAKKLQFKNPEIQGIRKKIIKDYEKIDPIDKWPQS